MEAGIGILCLARLRRQALRASALKYREERNVTSLRSALPKCSSVQAPDCPFVRTALYFGPNSAGTTGRRRVGARLPCSMRSSRRSSSRRAERGLFVRQQQAVNASHPFPVVFVGSSTDEADLIVLAVAPEPWPTKLMGAQIAEESLQESHVCCSLRARPDSAAQPVPKSGG